MSRELLVTVLRSALYQRAEGVRFGPRTWLVRWPSGLIEPVQLQAATLRLRAIAAGQP